MIKKYKISILLSILVFSLVFFGKGIHGGGLDIINNLGFVVVYSIPIFFIERRAQLIAGKKISVFLKIIWHSLRIASLSTLLWFLAFGFLFYHPQQWENGFAVGMMRFFGFFYMWPIFFIGDIVLFLLLIGLKKVPLKDWLGALVLMIAAIFFAYGIWLMAKCDFAGCKNPEYRSRQALKKNDYSYCGMNGYSNPNDIIYMLAPTHLFYDNREQCYKLLANQTNDVKICSLLPKPGFDDIYCYKKIAVNLSDTLICDKFLDRKFDKGDCYSKIAIKNNNIPLCETAGAARNDCYFETALELKDESICSKITFEIGKDNCLKNLRSTGYTPMRIGLPKEDENY